MKHPGGPAVEIRVLGPLEVGSPGEWLPLGSPKQRALLAALVISANRVVSVDRLIDELWGDEPPSRAMASLQAYVSRLRRLLQPAGAKRSRSDVLVTQAPGYVLRLDPMTIDAERFERGTAEGTRLLAAGDAAGALTVLGDALGLWRGPAYADFTFEQFAQTEITRLTELRLAAIDARLAALIETGQEAVAIAEAEAIVHDHPHHEGVWASLMTALYRVGRQGDALRAYERARRLIGDELGLDPGPGLQKLEADILRQSVNGGPATRRPSLGTLPDTPAPSSPPEPAAPGDEPLVGRTEEMRRLGEAVDAALGGRGRIVLLHGEPGIGKTRLAEETARRAAEAGALVGRGACVDGNVTAAYWPWTHALRALLEDLDQPAVPSLVQKALSELAQLDPALARWSGGAPAPPPLADPELARSRLQRAAVDTVLGLAASRPVTVVLEDLQWADQSSLQLLSLVAHELAGAAVLVVATYRDQEVGPALAATLSAVHRLADSVDVTVGGLDAPSIHRFVELAAGRDVSEAVARSIAARTSGNPLFVGELTRLLRSEGTLHEDAVRQAPVPAGVREVIGRRLERLPAQATTVLTVAAVFGRRFPLALLEQVTELSEDEVLDWVESGLATGLVAEAEGSVGTYEFTHDLVRETLQVTISGTRRARLHAKVAKALLDHGDDRDPTRPFEVAHHLMEALPMVPAGDVARHVLAAADAAVRRFAFEQAEEELWRALTLVEQLPGDARAAHELAVRVRLARVLTLSRGHASPEEREHAGRAVELAELVEPSPDVLLALWGAAVSAGMAGEFATTVAIGRKLLAWGEERQDRTVSYLGHAVVGGSVWYLGDLATAARSLGMAVDLLDAGELDPGLYYDRTHGVWSRAAHGIVAWLAGRDEESEALMNDALRRAEGPGRAFGLIFALLFDAILATMRGDRAHARGRAAEVVARADAIGYRQFSEFGRILAASAQDDQTLRAVELGAAVASQSAGVRLFQPLFLTLHAEALLDVGQSERAAGLLARALDVAHGTGERFYEPETHRLLGVLALREGRLDDAATHLRRGCEVAGELGIVALGRRVGASLEELQAAGGHG